MGDGARQIMQHLLRHLECRMVGAGSRDARLEDAVAQLLAERTHLDHEPAREPRAHAVIEAFEIGRRAVGSDHDLAAGVDQRVQRVAELGLRRLALQELQIVDDEHVDAAQRFLEGQRRLRLQRGDEAVHEFLGGEIKHLALVSGIAGPGHRLKQMRLAEADAGMDVERIEHHGIAAPSFGDLACGRMGQRVGAADDEAREGQARIERRAAERVVIGRDRRGRGRAQLRRGRAASLDRRGCFLRLHHGAHSGPDREIDAMHFRHLGLPARQHALGIVGLDPALQEARRDRKPHALILHAFQIHACKPARVDVLANARAQPPLHA